MGNTGREGDLQHGMQEGSFVEENRKEPLNWRLLLLEFHHILQMCLEDLTEKKITHRDHDISTVYCLI